MPQVLAEVTPPASALSWYRSPALWIHPDGHLNAAPFDFLEKKVPAGLLRWEPCVP